jgi:hypothetical protein
MKGRSHFIGLKLIAFCARAADSAPVKAFKPNPIQNHE